MKLLNLIIYLAISLWLILLTVIVNNLTKEVTTLKATNTIHNQEIMALRGHFGIVEDKCQHMIDENQRMIDEVREIVNVPYSKLIPIDGGWLAIREKKDADN